MTIEPLNVECCSPPQIKMRAIENLVMPPDRLTLSGLNSFSPHFTFITAPFATLLDIAILILGYSTVKALVKKYTDNGSLKGKGRTKPWTADFIENKGEGQIFLLHGSPGVGKTYVC